LLRWRHLFESLTVTTMTWLTARKYLCHKWPWICSVGRNHNPVLSSIMTYHRFCNKINTTDATFGAATADPSGSHELSLLCSRVRVARCVVFCVVFCRLLFALLVIVLSVLWFTASCCLFSVFNLFLSVVVRNGK